jgi:hypothetical protein
LVLAQICCWGCGNVRPKPKFKVFSNPVNSFGPDLWIFVR